MKRDFKFKVRRFIGALLLIGIFMAFTTSILIKTDLIGRALDIEFARQDRIIENHFNLWAEK